MSVPLAIFLYLYFVAVIAFLVSSAFSLYHAWRFGMATKLNKVTMIVYSVVGVLLIVASLFYIATTDWSGQFQLFLVDQGVLPNNYYLP